MGVVAVNSDLIANAVASPRVQNASGLDGGMVRFKQSLTAIANGDSSTSIYRLLRLPSNAYVIDLTLTTADIGTTATADIGLYYPTTHSNGGTVIDVDAYASAVSLKDGALSHSDIRFESGAAAGLYTNASKPLWQAAGLSSDPGGEFDLAMTLTANTDAAGTVLTKVLYSI